MTRSAPGLIHPRAVQHRDWSLGQNYQIALVSPDEYLPVVSLSQVPNPSIDPDRFGVDDTILTQPHTIEALGLE
jgi:hypothetical protein